jgi:hypothetical protein
VSDMEDTQTLASIRAKCEIPTRTYVVDSTGNVPVDMDMDGLPAEYAESPVSEMGEDEDVAEMDMSDVEQEEVEPVETAPVMPEIRFRPVSKKQRAAEERAMPALSAAEMAVNPQHGLSLKKSLKAKKKESRKAKRAEGYDFAEHFEMEE